MPNGSTVQEQITKYRESLEAIKPSSIPFIGDEPQEPIVDT